MGTAWAESFEDMRPIGWLPLLLLAVAPAPAWADGAAAPAVGRVVGGTVAVSGVPAPARPVAAAASVPARAAASDAAVPVARAAATGAVTIKDFSFGPATVTVHVGDTVTWANAGPTDHTATANDGGFDTGQLRAGQSASHTFTRAGTFAYHCSLHPFMRGTVQVLAAAASGGTGGGATAPAASAPAAPVAPAATPAAAAPAPPPAGATLPRTGMSAPGLAGLGALVLLCGIGLRARTRPR